LERAAVWLVAGGLLWRAALAAWLPLGLDETYAIAAAREFSISFFDHPPIGFWLPVWAAWLTGVEHPFVYRLPAVVLGTVTAVGVWRLGTMLGGARAGLAALALYTVAPHMVVGAGIFVLPDAPLDAALVWLAVVLVAMTRQTAPPGPRLWAGAGVLFALALASKYQAGLVAVGLLGFLLADPARRRWLVTPGPWLGVAVGLIGLAPVLWWNAQNDWASLAFHGARTGQPPDPLNLLKMTAIQAVYLLPPVAVVIALGMAGAARAGAAAGARLLLWLSGVQIGLFSVIYLFGTYTFAHWTMPGWLLALPLGGWWLATAAPAAARRARRWIVGVAVPVWALALLAAAHVNTGVLTRALDPIPEWDNTREIFRWDAMAGPLAAGGWLDGAEMLVAGDWVSGGQISTALGGRLPMRVLSQDAHHFAFMSAATREAPALMLVIGAPEAIAAIMDDAAAVAARAGAQVVRRGTIVLPRGGRPYAAVGALRLEWP
jgi:4-amino-4-deoxy-L-arabinose transferase-like glycosyltransferase